MRKASLLTLVLLFTGILAGYSQQTTAPDQPANQNTNQAVQTVSNDNNSNVQEQAAETSSNTNAAPIITEEKEVSPVGGVTYSDGTTTYASGDVQFEIQAVEDISGVKQIEAMLDDSSFSVYEKPIGFDSEGQHVIAYKAENNVGNVSPVKYYEFTLDKTPPDAVLTSDQKAIQIGGVDFVNSNYNFSITAQDRLSGVKSIEYSVDGGEYQAYSAVFAIPGPNGMHKIEYKSTDNVGNESKVKAYDFSLDINPPTVQIDTTPAPFVKDGVNYISGSSLIVITASDAETGISSIKYTIDGGDEINYSYPFKLTGGQHTIKAKATDLLGNVSDEVSLIVTVDVNVPETEIKATK